MTLSLLLTLLPCTFSAEDPVIAPDFQVKIVHGYYPAWRRDSHPPEQFDFSRLNRVGHCFAYPSEEGELIIPAEVQDPAP